MLSRRVIASAAMILSLLGAAAFDAWLDGVRTPSWLGGVVGRETLPPGMMALPVVLGLAVLSARELANILVAKGVQASVVLTCGMAAAGVLLSALVPASSDAFTGAATMNTATALVLAGSLAYYARGRRLEGVIAAACGTLFAFASMGLTLGFIVALRREHSVWVVVWVLLTTKLGDIGAYYVGRRFGRRKLAPWLSPGKTWEGLAGGLVFAAASGAMGGWWFGRFGWEPGLNAGVGVLLGVLFALVGLTGDLLASILKRDAGQKDAGTSVPGFGGVIDVVDSLLLVGPVAFWVLRGLG